MENERWIGDLILLFDSFGLWRTHSGGFGPTRFVATSFVYHTFFSVVTGGEGDTGVCVLHMESETYTHVTFTCEKENTKFV